MNTIELTRLKDQIRRRYRNGPDNIGSDFVAPCLKFAKLYRRGTGFFSSGALVSYAGAMDKLIGESIKIEILCSPVVHDKDLVKTLEENLTEDQRLKTIQRLADRIVLNAVGYAIDKSRRDYKKNLLAYLIAKGVIEIRFAVPLNFQNIRRDEETSETSHLYHVKTGYFLLRDDSVIGFDGSFNESDSGHNYHVDQTQVWRSWRAEDGERLNDIIDDIDNDWNGRNRFLKTYKVSEEAMDLIRKAAPGQRPKSSASPNESAPQSLRYYQIEALKAWQQNGFTGIIALATGTGKTKAAIAAIKDFKRAKPNALVIVTVPYIQLAKQWELELGAAKLATIKVYDSVTEWQSRVINIIETHNSSAAIRVLPILVCVNKTFCAQAFQGQLSKLNVANENRLLVVDECHHFNSSKRISQLPKNVKYRIGLSATPYEPGGPRLLEEYFSDVVYEYSIGTAIHEKYLSEYDYYPIFIEFTKEEAELYVATIKAFGRRAIDDADLEFEAGEASNLHEIDRILETVAGKMKKLEEMLADGDIKPFTLFYCGEGYVEMDGKKVRQIDILTRMLHRLDWKVGRVTSSESTLERKNTLDAFTSQAINAIASMRVLDEGIDIPDCQQAFIMASQRLQRQAIQRRGRILRKSDGKGIAKLYDFIIVGPKLSDSELQSLYQREIGRARLFAKDAKNRSICEAELEKI